MKKTISILIMLLVMFPALCSAEVADEASAGITPDMGILYNLDVWFDELKVNAAQTGIEKARIRLMIAEERAVEMKVMGVENKIEEMGVAQTEHEKHIKKIDEITDFMDDDNEKIDIQERLQKHIMTLERVREQVPEQAWKGIDNALDQSSKVFQVNQIKITINNRPSVEDIKARIKTGDITIKSVRAIRRRLE